jgi:hypothetical protein
VKALSNAIAALPSKDALDTLWQTLDGYWNGKDHPIFFGFIYEDGQHALTYGQWNSEWQELGPVIGSRKTDQYVAELTVNLPAVEENAFSDGRPATEVTVTIDFNSFRSDGEVRINANDHWSTCIWRGTAGESHKNANPY